MQIRKLVFSNFRNLKGRTLDTSSKQIVLTGENGQGKTNLLEAIYMLCYGSSFRTQNLRECISYDSDFFYLKSVFEDRDGFERTGEISFDGSKKTIRIDSNPIRDRKDLIYNIPCIVFSHDDIEFVRGEPENRRKFFDQTMSMYDSVFFDDLRRYKQVLRQRNLAIKSNRQDLLDIYDVQLACLSIPIINARQKVCSSFSEIFPSLYEKVSLENRNINISYKPSIGCDLTQQDIVEHLRKQRETDLRMMTTTSGPHRDRFIISDRNGLFSSFASTGQMRLASLILRSAQAQFFRQMTSSLPIFLMDDVLLELDSAKRGRYLSSLGDFNQAFYTFLPEEKYFSDMVQDNADILRYDVREGDFIRNEG